MEYSNNAQHPFGAPEQKRRGSGGFGVIIILLLIILIGAICVWIALFGGGICGEVQSLLPKEPPAVATPAPTAIANPNPTATPAPSDRELPALDGALPSIALDGNNPIPDIFAAVSDSVVGVVNYTMQTFGGQQMLAIYGSGSGFIVSASGYVLTNAHVVDDAQVVTVLLDSGEEIDATIIGQDEETDIAVPKIEHPGLTALALGDSDAVRVGEFVLAIGNPLDMERLANTLTYGILSAKNREITIDGHTNTYLQTDAAINYGNSGGPLLNLRGEVIGMNSAKTVTAGYDAFGNTVSAEGIGFALPINTVVEIMEQLIQHGSIERPAVGITVYTLTEAMAAKLGVPQGVFVESVVKGGPAAQAGLRAGDVILAANGREISEQKELIAIINECSVGDSITLRVHRAGEELELTIRLGNKTAMDFEDIEEREENERH